MGSAWTEWVRPIWSVRACSRARADERPDGIVEGADEQRTGRLALEREAGVDDVAAGQPEVEPATGIADGLRDLAHERDDIVVGGPLELRDALHVHATAGLDLPDRVTGTIPCRASTSSTASSTRSIDSKRAWSVHRSAISGSE